VSEPATAEVVVCARSVSKDYGDVQNPVRALAEVDLTLSDGDYVAIMGPSGSGKSTLLHLLGLLHRASRGTLALFGQESTMIGRREAARLRNREIGFVFQDPLLIPSLDIVENTALPLVYCGVPRAERMARARALLERMGLGHRLEHGPSALSGGECQRTAIARALVNDPRLVLADEPTGSLDQANGQHIMGILDGLHRDGRTVVIVTHDPNVARHARETINMRDGRIVSRQRSPESTIEDRPREPGRA
jgi:putative ABC transport system ATP-binding protein